MPDIEELDLLDELEADELPPQAVELIETDPADLPPDEGDALAALDLLEEVPS